MAQSLTARFFILVSLLAILSTGAYFAVQRLIVAQEDMAEVVGISGSQLLHAQRIATSAVALVDADLPENRTSAAALLRQSVDVMRNSHSLLTSSRGPLADLFRDSETLQRLYFAAPYHLDVRIRKYLQDAENLLAAKDDHARASYEQNLLRLSQGNFTEGLALAVKEYQKEVAGRLRWLQYLRLGILGAIYLLLALDGLLVFRPLLRRVRSDAEEMSGLRRELEDSASRDPLTHVLNRRMFGELVARELAFSRRHGNPLSALLLDIQGLAEVNRDRGAPSGDRLLEEVAQLLLNNVRISDYVFRYDGSRFAVLAPSTDRAGATALADKLACLIQANRFHGGIRVSVLVGVRMLALDDDAQTLPARLEETLAEAKTCGGFLSGRTSAGQES
ncbi:sensor domain-containing diguanylate cyclase [Paucidesulfovibrio longus]|uniref:sensor domain-containing diguanylate cyclase n=1 Tax=Paucidesulfovibrio longus TaxID=889 RepID=UPI0003B537BE|nr:diguanylate cyclase [Paucidesulfovibrio longus]